MENLKLSHFTDLTSQYTNTHRDIVVKSNGDVQKSNFFRCSISSAHRQENIATMNAFRKALHEEYGVFGDQAFDHVLTERLSREKSLRFCDVRDAVTEAQGKTKFKSMLGEGMRQMAIHPKYSGVAMTPADREAVKTTYTQLVQSLSDQKPFPQDLNVSADQQNAWHDTMTQARSMNDLSEVADRLLALAFSSNGIACEWAEQGVQGATGDQAGNGPVSGLASSQKFTMLGNETSVEDRVRSGEVGRGMTLNLQSANPYILDALKDKGVEPGFIAHHDWSMADTRSYMKPIDETALRRNVYALQNNLADGGAGAQIPDDFLADGEALRQAAMALGEKCDSYMSLLGEKLLGDALGNANHELHGRLEGALLRAAQQTEHSTGTILVENGKVKSTVVDQLAKHFAGKAQQLNPGEQAAITALAKAVKLESFPVVRDTIMSGKGQVDGNHQTVQRFQERMIVKLDYNQSDRFFGLLHKPLRTSHKMLGFYRLLPSTIHGTNAGAVGEVLANDLTRLTGVQTQELSLIRGQYSNGRTKLMLAGKMAVGYRDFDTCLVDGRLVMPKNGQITNLGSYKAGFVLMGDRDAVGSKAQNKGFIGNNFFAIDPGHSLENSKISLQEDFSLGGSSASSFKNFSVFDDTTRADKFQGILRIRDMRNNHTDTDLFDKYENQFSQEADPQLRKSSLDKIAQMRSEFESRRDQILDTFASQLAMHEGLTQAFGNPGLANKAIEMEANLSKIVSDTRVFSEHKEVELRHLEVQDNSSKMQFRGAYQADSQELVYESIDSSSSDAVADAVEKLRGYMVGDGVTIEASPDGKKVCVRIAVDQQSNTEARLACFDEDQIMMNKHTGDLKARLANNLEKLTNTVKMDMAGRHLLVDESAYSCSWQVMGEEQGEMTFRCVPSEGGDCQAAKQQITAYFAAHNLGAPQFTDAENNTSVFTLSHEDTITLYQHMDEASVIAHKGL